MLRVMLCGVAVAFAADQGHDLVPRIVADRVRGRDHDASVLDRFLAGIERLALGELRIRDLVPPAGSARGNFLVFDVDDAGARHRRISENRIGIDRRDRRLRFGFGVYHDDEQVDRLLVALSRALR